MKTLIRSAIGLLAAFYAVVGYTALHPRVSESYRAYYITGTDFMSPWQHKMLVPLQGGTTYGPDDPILAYDGWYLRDDKQRWNAGRSARFLFRVGDAGRPGTTHTFTLHLTPRGPQRTVWRLNGREIGAHRLDAAGTLRLPLDGALLHDGENELSVTLPDARPVGKGNPRMWALRFDGLRFD
jgi:hypothetical protein